MCVRPPRTANDEVQAARRHVLPDDIVRTASRTHFKNVAEAGGSYKAGARAFTFDKGIGGQCRSMNNNAGHVRSVPGFGHYLINPPQNTFFRCFVGTSGLWYLTVSCHFLGRHR